MSNMYRIYKEVWQDQEGICLDIAFTQYEMDEMPTEYRRAKRNSLAEQYHFNIAGADNIRTYIISVNDDVRHPFSI